MIEVVQLFGWHFACRDHQKAAYTAACDNPPPDYLGLHVDFGQSRTLPVGPAEGGRWWYANARLSVTVFVVYVWGADVDIPGYYMYFSDVLDHTPDFSVACLDDLLRRVCPPSVSEISLWADVGTHFRAARTWGYWLDYLPTKMKCNTSANYFPDGHGKEEIDGHIGRVGRWIREIAKKKCVEYACQFQCTTPSTLGGLDAILCISTLLL